MYYLGFCFLKRSESRPCPEPSVHPTSTKPQLQAPSLASFSVIILTSFRVRCLCLLVAIVIDIRVSETSTSHRRPCLEASPRAAYTAYSYELGRAIACRLHGAVGPPPSNTSTRDRANGMRIAYTPPWCGSEGNPISILSMGQSVLQRIRHCHQRLRNV